MVDKQRRLFGNSGQDDLNSGLLADWTAECQTLGGYWFAKRLSANDTGASGSHQVGLYVPKEIAFRIFPELTSSGDRNPESSVRVVAGSHSHETTCRMVWYRGGTRDETRITRWGGRTSPVQDPDNTGAIALFFFSGDGDGRECRYWVCRDERAEDGAEDFAGPVEPGEHRFWKADGGLDSEMGADCQRDPCWVEADQLPEGWLETFPSTLEIFEKALELAPYRHLDIDERVVRRRQCEYSVFRSVEHVELTQIIRSGFQSTDHFLTKAQSVLQRRKSRSGRSLELQVRAILNEENVNHTPQPTIETNNRPDFIFPSQADYSNPAFPAERLRMLGCKSTVKERWEQVVGEADRISFEASVYSAGRGIERSVRQDEKQRCVPCRSPVASFGVSSVCPRRIAFPGRLRERNQGL